jgi:RimJ/RimL family protein N-acetyltransferase
VKRRRARGPSPAAIALGYPRGVQPARYRITWPAPDGTLEAIEPRPEEVARHAAALAAAYNDPHNAPLLGHTEPIAEAEVVAHYASLAAGGGHGFLVLRDGALVADGDLRGVADGAAELAFLVTAVSAQGKGLGTRVATMIHAFAFRQLGLDRIYASVMPANTASRRVFEKLGHALDTSPRARVYADEPDDLVLAIDRDRFARSHAAQLAEIAIAAR